MILFNILLFYAHNMSLHLPTVANTAFVSNFKNEKNQHNRK